MLELPWNDINMDRPYTNSVDDAVRQAWRGGVGEEGVEEGAATVDSSLRPGTRETWAITWDSTWSACDLQQLDPQHPSTAQQLPWQLPGPRS